MFEICDFCEAAAGALQGPSYGSDGWSYSEATVFHQHKNHQLSRGLPIDIYLQILSVEN